jgi:hypothetical protein
MFCAKFYKFLWAELVALREVTKLTHTGSSSGNLFRRTAYRKDPETCNFKMDEGRAGLGLH